MKNSKWIAQNSKDENGFAILINLIKILKLPVATETILEVIRNTDEYPKITSLSKALKVWKVDNMIVKLEPENLDEIPLPAIAFMHNASNNKGDGYYVMISEINNEQITYLDTEKGYITEIKDAFCSKWSGITLLISVTATSGDVNYKKNKKKRFVKKIKKSFIYSSLGILLITILFFGANKEYLPNLWIPIFSIKILGTIICIILLKYTLGNDSTLIDLVCNLNKKTQTNSDCTANILDSPVSKIYGIISVSEVGLLYFIGGIFTIILGLFSNNISATLAILGVLNLLALPYTFFSIYYQAKVLKKWCKLCVSIQIILWLESILFFYFWKNYTVSFGFLNFATTLFGLLLPALIWVLLRSGVGLLDKISALKEEILILHNNPAFFESEVKKGRFISQKSLESEVIIGSPKSEHIFTVITNPFCSACRASQNKLEELINKLGDNIKMVIHFAKETNINIDQELKKLEKAFENSETKEIYIKIYGKKKYWQSNFENEFDKIELKNNLLAQLVSIYNSDGLDLFLKAMNDLYTIDVENSKAVKKWQQEYKTDEELSQKINTYFQEIREWVSEEKIDYTPYYILDQKELANGDYIFNGLNNYISEKDNGNLLVDVNETLI